VRVSFLPRLRSYYVVGVRRGSAAFGGRCGRWDTFQKVLTSSRVPWCYWP